MLLVFRVELETAPALGEMHPREPGVEHLTPDDAALGGRYVVPAEDLVDERVEARRLGPRRLRRGHLRRRHGPQPLTTDVNDD